MTRSEMFKKAHEIAKNNTRFGGDYRSAFAKALKRIYAARYYVVESAEGWRGMLGSWTITGEVKTERFNTIEEAGRRAYELKETGKYRVFVLNADDDVTKDAIKAYEKVDQLRVEYTNPARPGKTFTRDIFRGDYDHFKHVIEVDGGKVLTVSHAI